MGNLVGSTRKMDNPADTREFRVRPHNFTTKLPITVLASDIPRSHAPGNVPKTNARTLLDN
jgi:hypothetical protein